MRLFIALNFSPRFREALSDITGRLAAESVFGRPTPPENHHLTLAFIGESERAEELGRLLLPAPGPAFTLVTARPGLFRRSGGDVCWLGLAKDPDLTGLQRELARRLNDAGFELERRPFRPHLTLLRQAVFPPEFDLAAWGADLPALHERIDRVSLMESRRAGSRMVYREVSGVDLP